MKIHISSIYDSEPRRLHIGPITLPWPFPISFMLTSSAAKVFGVPVYGHRASPFIKITHRGLVKISNARWWFQYRFNPRHKYNVIYTDLEPGYYEPDTLILHGCMAMLARYIEEAGGVGQLEEFNTELAVPGSEGHGPREAIDSQLHSQRSALEIYRWWTSTKPADEKRRDDLTNAIFVGKDRLTWVPTENSDLFEMQFKPFEGDEVALHAELRALENKITQDEQTMLHALIDIRQSLWT